MFLVIFCNLFISELNATQGPSLANEAYTCIFYALLRRSRSMALQTSK